MTKYYAICACMPCIFTFTKLKRVSVHFKYCTDVVRTEVIGYLLSIHSSLHINVQYVYTKQVKFCKSSAGRIMFTDCVTVIEVQSGRKAF